MATIAKTTKRKHTKPSFPKEAEKVTKQMYESLTAPNAPRATQMGYIMGASMVLKMLIDQAVSQGGDKEALKAQAMTYIQMI